MTAAKNPFVGWASNFRVRMLLKGTVRLRETSFVSPRPSMFPEAKPSGTLRIEGKQNSLFPKGPVMKCFVIPPNSKIEKKMRKNDLLDAYGGCACSTSSSETKLCYRNDTITVFVFAANKK